MLKEVSLSYSYIVDKYSNDNPWTNVYGLSRSIIAFGLLITLLFSGIDNLFPTMDGHLMKVPNYDFERISIFYLLQDHLIVAYYISIIILLSVISGFIPQITGLLHWWITMSYLLSGVIVEGGDQIAAIVTLLLIPVTMTDNRLNHWHKPKLRDLKNLKLFIWSVFAVIMLQIGVIYFHSGIAKMSVKEWVDGTATYYWFTHSEFGVQSNIRNGIANLFSNPYVVILFSWGTMIFEILLFSWLFIKRNSWNWKVFFILAVTFHFGIFLVHGLFSFMLTMTGALILYLFPVSNHIKFRRR